MTVSLSNFMGDLLRDRFLADDPASASAQHEVVIIPDNCKITEDRWIKNRHNFAAPAALGKCRWSSNPDLLELHAASSSPTSPPVNRRRSIGCIRDANADWVNHAFDARAFANPLPFTASSDVVQDAPLIASPSCLKSDRARLLKRLYSELSAPQRPQRVVSPVAPNSKPLVESAGLLKKMQASSGTFDIMESYDGFSADVLEMPRRMNSFNSDNTNGSGLRTPI